MLRTWTDTHYNLAENDWLYIAKHEREKSVSLVCPGYARDGQGFSIHFSSAQISVLEQLLQALREMEAVSADKPSVALAIDCNSEAESQTYGEVISLWDEMPKISVPVSTNPKLITYPVGREK
jgi:alpha-amylase/alpha-mannosidase (GH57 family)